jgi:hypothetical protein
MLLNSQLTQGSARHSVRRAIGRELRGFRCMLPGARPCFLQLSCFWAVWMPAGVESGENRCGFAQF